MTLQKQYGVWNQYVAEGYSSEAYSFLKSHARVITHNFMMGVRDNMMPLSDLDSPIPCQDQLDNWVKSEQGQKTLLVLVQDIIAHITGVAQFGLPAHDARQVMFKDVSEGLRFLSLEQPTGYQASFIIPMMCHDIGRLCEGRLYHPTENPHPNWIPHAQLSFLLLKEILDQPHYADMPNALKQHYLYAVLQHSTENGKSYMSRAVQTCDRMQLIGAEGFFRGLSFFPCLMKGDIAYPNDPSFAHDLPDMKGHKSLISYLEFFARNMLENLGDRHSVWQTDIAIENVAILMMLSDGKNQYSEELFEKIFAPELRPDGQYGIHKRPIPHPIMSSAFRVVDSAQIPMTYMNSPQELADFICHELQSPRGAAVLTPDMRADIHKATSELPYFMRHNLFRTIMMASEIRAMQDNQDAVLCRGISQNSTIPEYIRTIAQLGVDNGPRIEIGDQPKSYRNLALV